MATENKINILVSAVDEASKVLDSVGGSITSFAKNNEKLFKGMRNIGAAAFASIGGSAMITVNAFKESEAQLARVDQTLRNSDFNKLGISFEEVTKKAREFGSSLQSLSGIGDEAAAESFSRLIQLTGDLQLSTEGAYLAADIATAKQVDMATGTQIVALALEGNVRALKAYGIEIEEGASKMEVLDVMYNTFGGQAEAFGQTLEGQSAILKQSFGDIQESIGGALAPALSQLLATVQPLISSFSTWATDNPETVKTIVLVGGAVTGLVAVLGTLGLAIPVIIGGITALGAAFSFLTLNPIGLTLTALAALGTAGWYLYENWDQVKTNIILVWQQIGRDISYIIDVITLKFSQWITNAKLVFTQLWADIKAIIEGVKAGIVEATMGVFNSMYETIQGVFSSITTFIQGKIDWVLQQLQRAKDALKEIATLGGANTATFNGARAVGGYTTPNTPYLVGERGPEIFMPTGSGRVIPNNQLGGGQSINISFGDVTISNGMDLNDLTEKIKTVIYNEHKYARLGY